MARVRLEEQVSLWHFAHHHDPSERMRQSQPNLRERFFLRGARRPALSGTQSSRFQSRGTLGAKELRRRTPAQGAAFSTLEPAPLGKGRLHHIADHRLPRGGRVTV